MTQVIEAIEQALQEQDIDKVYEHYHHFFDNFDPEKDLQIGRASCRERVCLYV